MGTVTWKADQHSMGKNFPPQKLTPLGPIKITHTLWLITWNEKGGDLLYRGANDMESNDRRC